MSECDIGDERCQEHYSALIRCIREDDQPTPRVEVLSEYAYSARYIDGREPVAPRVPLDRALKLLGLRSAAKTVDESIPAARYDAALRTVVVVDTDDVQAQLRAISQAHADAASDFSVVPLSSEDHRVAVSALFLGESIFYGDAAWYKTTPETREAFAARLTDNLYYGDEQADAARVARFGHNDLETTTASFAAGYGPEAVLAAWLAGGGAAVRAGYGELVTSASQIVLAALDEPPELVELDVPVLPAGVTVMTDSLGPWLLHVMRTRDMYVPDDKPIAEDLEDIERMARNWRGDVLLTAHDEQTGRVGVVLVVALADPNGWSPADSTWLTADDGRVVTLVLAEDSGLEAALTEAVVSGTRRRMPLGSR